MASQPSPLMMLDRWIELAVSRMDRQFSTHEFIEKIRELYPVDYAHDLAVCTLDVGFPKSLGVLHQAMAIRLRRSGRVAMVGRKESRDLRGNKHLAVVWERLDEARLSRPREPGDTRKRAAQRKRTASRKLTRPRGP